MNRLTTPTLWSALLGLLLLTASCDKKNNEVTPGSTSTDGLVASFVGVRWQMSEFTLDQPIDLNGDGKPDSDLTVFLEPCDLDNTIVFERNGTMTGDNGKLKCDTDNDPTTHKPSSWTYDNTAKILRIVNGEDNSVSQWNVIEASAKFLKVKVAITEDGQPLGATMTWKSV